MDEEEGTEVSRNVSRTVFIFAASFKEFRIKEDPVLENSAGGNEI